MFTGIIETMGVVEDIKIDANNFDITIRSKVSDDLKIDQSIAHDGVCLTVVAKTPGTHTVTAIKETLDRSNLKNWKPGDKVNLERAMLAGARLDGHIVQGHVDTTATVTKIENEDGSWVFHFKYEPHVEHILVDKGSVCVNGTSLTVVNPTSTEFSVAIIPYTFENTDFGQLKVGDLVNLEFDIIGKYLMKMAGPYLNKTI